MKLSALFEMPTLINSELPLSQDRFDPFYSIATVQRDFDIIWKQPIKSESHYVLLEKDRSFAIWGILTEDPNRDGVTGIEPITIVDFKDGLNVNSSVQFDHSSTLQIDLVQTSKRFSRGGVATRIYIKLAQAGFTIISDNEQWNGGKRLWKKLAHTSVKNDQVSVFLLRNNKLESYDGTNIPDDEIWSEDSKHKYTLFVLKSTI